MNAAQSLATFFVLPAVIALLGSYMICREEQEDTIKSLRLIPISEAKMTIAKLLITFAFSVLFYLLLFGITFLVEVILHFRGLSIKMILSFFKIYLLDGIGIFFAIAPVIAVVSRIKKGYWLAFYSNLFFCRIIHKYIRCSFGLLSYYCYIQYFRLLFCHLWRNHY